MYKYNFDYIVNRKNTNSIKYDFSIERGKPEDIIPFWVADMDFQLPKEILEKINEAVEHGIFGYSEVKEDYNEVVINWFKKHFGYELKSEWIVKTPGVVYSICTAIKAYTTIGDSILIQKPVYYPFTNSILDNERKLINNSLLYKDGKYSIDFEDFENKIIDNNVKMFILCSPHNPVGKVFTKEELIKMGNICLKHNVLIVSDEIHCDFTRKGIEHNIFLSLDEKFLDNTILLTAPSKTFNIAGLQVSNIFIPNKNLRKLFVKEIDKTGYSQLNTLGLIATKACYELGEEWLCELKDYLEVNREFIKNFLVEKLPKIKLVEPMGTYLVWLDFSELGLTDSEINKLIVNEAKLWLDNGTMFGDEGNNFQRINIACPKNLIETCMNNLFNVFNKY